MENGKRRSNSFERTTKEVKEREQEKRRRMRRKKERKKTEGTKVVEEEGRYMLETEREEGQVKVEVYNRRKGKDKEEKKEKGRKRKKMEEKGRKKKEKEEKGRKRKKKEGGKAEVKDKWIKRVSF